MSVLAQFPVERQSSNGQVRERVTVWAHDPEEARRVAELDGWCVLTCGPANWNSPADHGQPRIEQPGATVVVKLPPRFYEDHVSRDLPAGRVVRSTQRHVYVELDRAAHDELESDARFYAEMGSEGAFEPGLSGIVASARATLRALDAQPVPSC
jgi:hypothetical protein